MEFRYIIKSKTLRFVTKGCQTRFQLNVSSPKLRLGGIFGRSDRAAQGLNLQNSW